MAERAGTNRNRQGNDNPNPKPDDPNGPQNQPVEPKEDKTARQQLHKLGIDVSGFTTEQLNKVWSKLGEGVKSAASSGDLFAKQDLEQLFQDTNTGMRLENFNKYYSDAPYQLGADATGFQRNQAQAQANFNINAYANMSAEQLQHVLSNPGGLRYLSEDQVAQIRALSGAGGFGPSIYTPFTNFTGTQQGVPGYDDYMTSARNSFGSHYAAAAFMGDFDGANKAMSALQAHDAYSAPQAYTGPDTFSENDLY